MNNNQKQAIQKLRSRGISLSKIADEVGLPVNTVKSFCRRNSIGGNLCKNCGQPLVSTARRKPKTFCCTACRQAWWQLHQEQMNLKAVRHFVCAGCSRPFDGYGNNRSRKYCSRGCYIAHRYGVP